MKIELDNKQQQFLYLGKSFKNEKGEEYYMNLNIYKRLNNEDFEEVEFKSLPEGLKKFIVNNWMKDIKEYIKKNG